MSMNRKQSMVSSRKGSVDKSVVDMRRKSIIDRKSSKDGPGLMIPVGMDRRGSIAGRRYSISDRKFSMADSLAGRSGPLSAGKDGRLNIKYENTYKVEPDKNFPIYEAKKIAMEILTRELDGREYDKDDCSRLSRLISDRIKQQCKALGYPRYKIVAIVAIGQSQESHPSLSFTSRFIWNEKYDNFAEASFKSKHLFGVALVYAVYVD
ncbi:dynein light chain Tctex-type 5-like [Mya arenaria]|uniref:dynein light chain Tctex-type 5-like n=1 Tax=Mya arenaria TaxID=6604 RepID=UPI0022E03BD8|nr:dynein light chain Tctex-type 5-like [Mya arenaria]XP_052777349.1 dynein light chain Tctex-type 5-like [Mya arenaria]